MDVVQGIGMTSWSVESRMRGNAHVRFGGAGRGNGPRVIRYRASARPYAETVNGLFKTELIRAQGPWHTAEEVELATLGWVHWWNHTRLHSSCGNIPPAEFEAAYYASLEEGSELSIPII